MAHVPKERRRKWDEKSEEYIFVGYADETKKKYRLLNAKTKNVIIRRNIIFIENALVENNNQPQKHLFLQQIWIVKKKTLVKILYKATEKKISVFYSYG